MTKIVKESKLYQYISAQQPVEYKVSQILQQINQSIFIEEESKPLCKRNLIIEVQSINKAYQLKVNCEDGTHLVSCGIELDIDPINHQLKKYAIQNGYSQISISRKRTLRGGRSISYQINYADCRPEIIKIIDNIKNQRNKIEEYCQNLIQTNDKLNLVITQEEINEVFSYGRQVQELVSEMTALGLAQNVPGRKQVQQKATAIQVDITFVIDATGSMVDLFENAKNKCLSIKEKMLFNNPHINFKFALIAYRDHPRNMKQGDKGDSPIFKVANFSNFQNIYEEMSTVECDNGDDIPQAVHDALLHAASQLNWRKSSHKLVYLIADSPPHGQEYHQNSCSDNYPSGCPCGIRLEDIVDRFKKKRIKLVFAPVEGEDTYKTADIFSLAFQKGDFTQTEISMNDFEDSINKQIDIKFKRYEQLLAKFNDLVNLIQLKRLDQAILQVVKLMDKANEIQRKARLNDIYAKYTNRAKSAVDDLEKLKEVLQKRNQKIKKNGGGFKDSKETHKDILNISTKQRLLSAFLDAWDETEKATQLDRSDTDENDE